MLRDMIIRGRLYKATNDKLCKITKNNASCAKPRMSQGQWYSMELSRATVFCRVEAETYSQSKDSRRRNPASRPVKIYLLMPKVGCFRSIFLNVHTVSISPLSLSFE